MNRLFLTIVAVVFCLAVPSAASAVEGPAPDGSDSGAPYCGQDVECPPPTRICDIGTDEDPVPAQEYCAWPEDPPVPCDEYSGWQEDPGPNEDVGEEGVEPGYPGGDYAEGTDPGYGGDGDGGWTDPGYGTDDSDWSNPADGEYCVYYMTAGGPKTWKNPRLARAERARVKRHAARRRAVRTKRSRIQARRAKARQAAARQQARARATHRS